jgi:hypothetical protein
MRLVARWGVATAVSAAGFGLAWWVCWKLIGLYMTTDDGAGMSDR